MIVDQLALFDAPRARAAGEAGMRLALRHADPEWREKAWAAILTLAVSGREFISDDVRRLVGDPPEGTSPNVMGALLSKAAKSGHLRMVGYGHSARTVGHQNLVRRWVGAA